MDNLQNNKQEELQKKVFVIDNCSVENCNSLLKKKNSTLEAEKITQQLIVCALVVVILVQIKKKFNQKPQYYDQLPSYMFYKQIFFNGIPGKTWCFLIAFRQVSDQLDVGLDEMHTAYLNSDISPTKKIEEKITKENASQLFLYIRTKVLGFLQACPSTKPAFFGLDDDCHSWNLEKTLNFICPNGLPKGITVEMIKKTIIDIALSKPNGKKRQGLEFTESTLITSTLEAEIFGNIVSRTGVLNETLVSSAKEIIRTNELTTEQLEQGLLPSEIAAYKIASQKNDKLTMLKYQQKAKENILKNNLTAAQLEKVLTPSDSLAYQKAVKKKNITALILLNQRAKANMPSLVPADAFLLPKPNRPILKKSKEK